jgi:hypothetical protein
MAGSAARPRSRTSVGVALVIVYLAAVAGTVAWSGRGVRPLFDGFEGGGPPRPYQWVEPPPGLGDGNITPRPHRMTVGFDAGVSEPAGITSGDSQLVLNLPAGAFPAEAGATGVTVAMTPVDPGTLGAAPTNYLPDGNAYRVRMSYEPGGREIGAAAVPGNIVLIVPQLAVTILWSPDGSSWEQLPSQLLGDPVTIGGSFTDAGYYLVGTTEPPPVGERSSSSGTGAKLALLVAITAGVYLALRFAPRRQRQHPPPSQWQEPEPESEKALPGSGTNRKS